MALTGTKFNELSLGQYGSSYTTSSSHAIIPPTNHIFAAITFLEDTVFDSTAGLVAETATKFVNTQTAANDLGSGSETEEQGSGGKVVDSVVFPKGITIFGRWTEIDLTSGSVIAYIAPKH
tara:strand:+ start:458 stop:820 length:363 start_codon:yes stop_codon:yes gene_type:complete